ncbi:MAG: hypothetical protein K6G10_09775, partial [Butyrivibrio sp.]|nr:hypothetical protein [Butyrivibrio sp.]
MKWFKECPLIFSLATVSLILTIISFALKDDVYESYTEGQKDFSHPVLSLVFRGFSDGVFPWSSDVQVIPGVGTEVVSLDEDTEREEEKENPEEEPAEAEDGAEDLTAEEENSEGEASEEEQDEELSEEDAKFPEILEFSEVDDDYFCDALFIGDSRTVGLSEYCEELDSRATFYSKISLTIFDCMTKEFIKTDEGKINIETALSQEQYSKI